MASYSKKPSYNDHVSNYIVSLCKNVFLLANDVCCQIALSVFAKIHCVIVFKLADYNPLSKTRRMFFLLLEIWWQCPSIKADIMELKKIQLSYDVIYIGFEF